MNFWKLSAPLRATIAGMISLLLAFSSLSPQALAEAVDEAAEREPTSTVVGENAAETSGPAGEGTDAGQGTNSEQGASSGQGTNSGPGGNEGQGADAGQEQNANQSTGAGQVRSEGQDADASQGSTEQNSANGQSGVGSDDATKGNGAAQEGTASPAAGVSAEREPQRWTIELQANGGALAESVTEEAARVQSVEDADAVTLPSACVREGYVLAGWSTQADPEAWQKAREEALEQDPNLSESADAPLWVPLGASLYNLTYAYVTLEDGTVQQVSDITATQGHDDEGREVHTCDLRGRVRDGKLVLYAQWKKAEGDERASSEDVSQGDPETADGGSKAANGTANDAGRGDGEPKSGEGKAANGAGQKSNAAGVSQAAEEKSKDAAVSSDEGSASKRDASDTDANKPDASNATSQQTADVEGTGGIDPNVELPKSAEPVADVPTGTAALLADPKVVLDSGSGDPAATATLDAAQKGLRAKSLFSNPLQTASNAPSGLGTRGLLAQDLGILTESLPIMKDGTTIEDFSLVWNTSDTTDDDNAAHLDLTPDDDAVLNMQARLQFAVSGERNYPAGAIQFTIPAQVIQDRSGNYIGSMTLGVPEEPDATQSFAYRLVTPAAGDPYFVITNTRTLDSATTGVIQFSIRGITPHVVHSGQPSPDLQAHMSLTTSRGNEMEVDTQALTATIHTEEHIEYAYKNGGRVMEPNNAPDEIRNALEGLSPSTTVSDYVLVRWNTYANVEGNQSFDFSLQDRLGVVKKDGTTIDVPGSVVLGATGSASDTPDATYGKDVLTGSYLESGESRYENVWTAYPKSVFEDGHTYEINNDVTWTVTPVDAPTTATHKDASAKITYSNPQPVAFTADPGHYNIEKETLEPHRYSTSSNTSLTDLHGIGTGPNAVAPKDATINFTVTAYGEIMEQTMAAGASLETVLADTQHPVTDPAADSRFHQRYVTMEANDDAIYLNGDYTSELGSDDYYISKVSLRDPYVYTYGHEDGDETKPWGYNRNTTAAPLPGMELWGLSEETGGSAETWTKYATVTYNDTNARSVTATNGATNEGPVITLPDSLGVTRVKVVSAAKDYDAVKLQFNPSVTLRHDGPRVKELIDRLFKESDSPSATLRNDVTLVTYHGNAVESVAGHEPDVDPAHAKLTADEAAKVFAIPASSQSVDYARTHAMDQARYGKDMWHYTSLAYMRGAVPRLGVTSKKTLDYDENRDLDAGAMRATLHYTATVHEQSNVLTREAYDQYVADGAILAETSGTWYDLLPPGVTPNLGTIKLRDADSVQDAYMVENYKGTGRTLLVVKAELVPRPAYNDTVQGAVAGEGYWAQGFYDEPSLSFDAIYSYADYSAVEITEQNQKDELINVVAFESGNDELGNQDGMMGEYDDATGGTGQTKVYRNKETEPAVRPTPDVANMATAMSDLDSTLGSNDKKPNFVYARAENRISVDRSSISSITKQVASDAEGIYRSGTSEKDKRPDHTNQVNVYEGHGYTYRIEVARGNGETSNIVLYDALENYQLNDSNSDWDIKDQRWKGTLTGVDTSQIEAMGVAPVVYYSTSVEGFDGRTSVGEDTHMGTIDLAHVTNTLDKNPSAWTRADQYSGHLSEVKAVAIDCSKAAGSGNAGFTLPAGKSLVAYIHMRAPTEVKTAGESNLFNKIAPADNEDEPNNNAHAFNNVYINSSVKGESETNAKTEFYHPDYVKVGILPYKIAVNKVWDDANNQDGKRPNAVNVQLLANGATAKFENGQDVPEFELGSEHASQTGYGNGGWSYTIEDIPYVDANNKPIRYTLSEDAITEKLDDQTTVKLYSPSYLRTDDAHLQITNKRVPETVDLVVNKTWNDGGNAAGKRPSTIQLRLYADGVYRDTETVRETSDGTWSYTFADLPAYKEGKKIVYTVTEDPVEFYATDYAASEAGYGSTVAEDGTIQGSVNITNTYSTTGLLGISKTAENVKSNAGRDANFSFKVELFGTERDEQQNLLPLGDTYAYYVLDAEGQRVAGSEKSLRTGDTVTIKAGQRAIIEGLPIGSTYKVTEQATPGFYQSASSNTTGTIRAGVTPKHAADVRFTNTYSSSGSFQLKATKKLQGQKLALYAFRFQAYRVFNEGISGNADSLQNEYEQIERSVSNSAGGDVDEQGVSTGDITFARFNVTDKDLGPDGKLTLLYRIREVQVARPGYTYADNVEQVRVTLTDKGDGTIEAEQKSEKVENGTSYIKPLGDDTQVGAGTSFQSNGDATFTNSYSAKGSFELTAWKALRGGTLAAGQFTLRLTALTEGAPMATIRNNDTGELSYDTNIYDAATRSMKATNASSGVVNFTDVQLTGANGGKSYIYKVSEDAGDDQNVNYSKEVYYYRVDVADDGAGNLTTTNTVVKRKADATDAAVTAGDPNAFEPSDAQPIITNTLKPGSLTIKKRLQNESAYNEEEFEFRVVLRSNDINANSSFSYKVDEGQPISDQNAVAAKGSYTMTVKLRKDQTATISSIPAGTTYQVLENTLAGWQLVEQSETAGSIVPQDAKNAVFTNNYDASKATVQLYATKTLDGAAAAENAFEFTLTGVSTTVGGTTASGAPMPAGVAESTYTLDKKNGAGGLVNFGTISYEAVGTYTYSIKEKAGTDNTIVYDAAEWTATVTVTNAGTEQSPVLAASVKYVEGAGDPSGTPPEFANTTKPGGLTVTKEGVSVTPANKDAEFNFTVQLHNSGQPVDSASYLIENADGTPLTTQSANTPDPLSALGRIASVGRDALVGLFTPSVAYADEPLSGTFGVGGSCTWVWDEATKTVTVRATNQDGGDVGTDIAGGPSPVFPWSYYSGRMEHFVVDSTNGKVSMSDSGASFTRVFYANESLLTVDLSGLDLDSYGDGNQPAWSHAFADSKNLTTVTLPYLSGSSYGINAESMFEGCENLNNVRFSTRNNGEASFEIYKASSMFKGCKNLETISLDPLKIKLESQGATLTSLFEGCAKLKNVNMGIQGAENISDTSRMFYGCKELVDIDLSKLVYTTARTPKLKDMNHMFTGCNKLQTLNYHGFKTEQVTDMNYMFYECFALTALDLSSFNTSSVTDYHGMFRRCTNLTTLDLSGFVTKSGSDGSSLFSNDSDSSSVAGGRVLTTIVLGNGWTEVYSATGLPDANWVKVEDVAAGTPKVLTSAELMGRSNQEYNTGHNGEYSGTWVRAVDPAQLYVVNFKTNGAYYDVSGGAVPGSVTTPAAESITLPTPKWDTADRVFVGWYREPDCSGTKFNGGTAYNRTDLLGANPTSAYVTLYAKWDSNAKPKGTINVYQQRTDLNADHGTYNLVESKEYTFTKAAGQNETITPDAIDGFVTPAAQSVTVANGATINFYYDREAYTVVFNKNATDATGEMADTRMPVGVAKQLPINAFTRKGCAFMGWNTKDDGTGFTYTDGQRVKDLAAKDGEVTLYAQWVKGSNATSSTGTYRFTLKAGQRVRFTNVPAGTTYSIVESDLPNGWTQTEVEGPKGTITANVTSAARVTNTYDATGVVSLQAQKTMQSGSLAEGQFSFQLLDSAGKALQTVTNQAPAEGTATADILFDAIDFKLSDLFENGTYAGPKEFNYTIREVVPDEATNGSGTKWADADADTRAAGGFSYQGVAYDSAQHQVKVTVEDAGTGKLTVTPDNVTTTGTGVNTVTNVSTVFTNDYQPGSLEVTKTTIGTNEASANKTFSFEVSLKDAQGNSVSGSSTNGKPFSLTRIAADGTETSDGTVNFDSGMAAIDGVRGGESFRIDGLPQGATYEVSEADAPGFTQNAVSGNKGTIGAGTKSEASFTNAYAAEGNVSLAAKKMIAGGNIAGYTFTFQLYDETNTLLQTKTNDTSGNVNFDAISFSTLDAGTQAEPKKYSYKIAEANDAQEGVAYDAHSAWLDVNVWDNGEGTITAQAVYDHEGDKPSATPETFMNKLLHPVELPATGGNGLAIPIAVAVIVATGEGARRMHRRRRE